MQLIMGNWNLMGEWPLQGITRHTAIGIGISRAPRGARCLWHVEKRSEDLFRRWENGRNTASEGIYMFMMSFEYIMNIHEYSVCIIWTDIDVIVFMAEFHWFIKNHSQHFHFKNDLETMAGAPLGSQTWMAGAPVVWYGTGGFGMADISTVMPRDVDDRWVISS